jgi:hypothetical protein
MEKGDQHLTSRNIGLDEQQGLMFLALIEKEMFRNTNAYSRIAGIRPIPK